MSIFYCWFVAWRTATVRKHGAEGQLIDACARKHIRAIDPWRDQVPLEAHLCCARSARRRSQLSGYGRGGMFTADAAHRNEARDDNRRAVDEAKALGAPCIVLVAGGLPQYSRPGSAPSRDIAAGRAEAS